MSPRIFLVAFLILPGCTREWWEIDADREVAEVLAEKRVEIDEFRARGVVRPEREAAPAAEAEGDDLPDVPRSVGLREALLVATMRNRNYTAERESLYRSALSLTGARNDFSVLFSGALSAVLNDTNETGSTNRNDASLGASKILRSGGRLSADVRGSSSATSGGAPSGYTFSSDWSVSVSQPLLRDAGYESSHESLTQAERNVVYAIRDFELFREDFTIQVLSQYYSLVRQLREIVNAERNLADREFLKNQSEAKWRVGLATEVDKLRAAREFLRAKNDFLDLRESYQLALDRMKILLGLPTAFPLEIRPEEPVYREVEIPLARAVEAALHNRLDLITTRDRLADSERSLRITARRLLPDLDLSAGFGRSAAGSESFTGQDFDSAAWNVGLTLTLPLERRDERNALRNAIIDLERARRSLSLAEDNVILEVRDSLRQLRRSETSIQIRKDEIRMAEKEARAAQIRFEEGRMDNRNLTDAQNAVLIAQNGYIRTMVDYEVARIQLYRDLGILFIDEKGMWVEP